MALTHPEAMWSSILGGAGVIASVAWALYSAQFGRMRQGAEGDVIEVVRCSSGDPEVPWTYSPRFRFLAGDGKMWTVLSKNGTMPSLFGVGEKVKVIYKPDDPVNARIDSATEMWLGPVMFGGIALGVMVVGLLRCFGREGNGGDRGVEKTTFEGERSGSSA